MRRDALLSLAAIGLFAAVFMVIYLAVRNTPETPPPALPAQVAAPQPPPTAAAPPVQARPTPNQQVGTGYVEERRDRSSAFDRAREAQRRELVEREFQKVSPAEAALRRGLSNLGGGR